MRIVASVAAAAAAAHQTPSPTPTPEPGSVLDGPPDPWAALGGNLPPTWMLVTIAVAAIALGVGLQWLYRALVAPAGMATAVDIRREMSARSARKMSRSTRPGLAADGLSARKLPTTQYSYLIGRSLSPFMWVRGNPEDSVLIVGPPGAHKTVWMTNVVIDAPGAVIATSSKIGDPAKSETYRARVGPVLLFNPQLLGGRPSTMRINPVRGCEVEEVAIRRGGFLLYGGRGDGDSTKLDDYFNSNANEVLRAFLHAAALGGLSLVDVYRWASDPEDKTALKILDRYDANPLWIHTLRSKQDVADRTRDGIFSTLATTLSWLASPEARRVVTPGPGEDLEVEEFIAQRGTLYLVGEHREGDAIAPLFTLLISHLVESAIAVADRSPHGRLDPWLTLALDEVATICPVPLTDWINKLREHGILPIVAIQSKAQLEARWGRAGGANIWSAMAYHLALRGIKSGDDLQELSQLCGDYEHRKVSWQTGPHGRVRNEHTEMRPVMPPHKIRGLKKGRVLVIYRGAPPTVVKVPQYWRRRDLRRIDKQAAAAPVTQKRPA